MNLRGRTLLASGGADRILVWDATSGLRVSELPGHAEGSVTALAFAVDDGRLLLASGGYDDIVRVWDVEGRQQLAELRGHTKHVTGLAWTTGQDGVLSPVSASMDGTMRWWDLEAQGASRIVTADREEVTALAVVDAPEGGGLLASAEGSGHIKLRDPATGSETGVLRAAGSVVFLAAHRNAEGHLLLASSSEDGTIRFWDVLRHEEIGRVQRSYDEPHPLVLLELGSRIIFAAGVQSRGFSQPIGLYDLDGTRIALLEGHTKRLDVLNTFRLPDGRAILASAAADSTVRLWDLSNPERLEAASADHRGGAHVAIFDGADHGATVIVGEHDGVLYHHDLVTGALRMSRRAHDAEIRRVALRTGHDGHKVLITADGNFDQVRFWNPATGEHLATYPAHGDEFALITDSRQHHLLVTPGHSGVPAPLILRFTDTDTQRTWNTGFRDRGSWVTALASTSLLSGDAVLAIGDHSGTIRLWSMTTGMLDLKVSIPVIFYGVHELSFLHLSDGRTWLIATSDAVYIWDLATGRLVHTLTGHTSHITSNDITSLADGRPILVTGSPDCTVRVWDPIAGRHLVTIPVDDAVINAAASATRIAVSTAHGLAVLDVNSAFPPAVDQSVTWREETIDLQAAEEAFREAAEAGQSRAMASLAMLLKRRGESSAAEHWLSRAADGGDPEAAFLLGRSHLDQGDISTAETFWQAAADHGSVHAARSLAFWLSRHAETAGVERFARIAADSNYADGMHLLGWLSHAQGDQAAAEKWYERAWRKGGDAESAYRLGEFCDSRGEPQKAETFFEYAAEADHPAADAKLQLAELRRRRGGDVGENDPNSMYARALEADSASQWHTWMSLAAAAAHGPAMRALGERYLEDGDHRKARYWLEAAAERYGIRPQSPWIEM